MIKLLSQSLVSFRAMPIKKQHRWLLRKRKLFKNQCAAGNDTVAHSSQTLSAFDQEEIPPFHHRNQTKTLHGQQLNYPSDEVHIAARNAGRFPNEAARTVNPTLAVPAQLAERFDSGISSLVPVDVFLQPQLPHQREFHSLSDSTEE